MSDKEKDNKIIDQFSIRTKSYNTSANWMMNSALINSHAELLGQSEDNKNCLDLCCGTGLVGRSLKEYSWNVTGLDLTPHMVAVANSFFPAKVGSVEEIPFADNSFDAAVLRQSFMLVDGSKTLDEIHRVLKKDGVFVISQSIPFGTQDDEHYQKVQWTRHINMKKYYNTEGLMQELINHGFEILETVVMSIEESVNKWLEGAPELSAELRDKIFNLIADAPESYKSARNVHSRNDEIFENWNWIVIKARAKERNVRN